MEELKNKISCLFILLALCAGVHTHAQDTTIFTLQKCIDMAIKNNLTAVVSDLQAEASKATLLQARTSVLPYASGYANQGISNGKSINPFTNTYITQEVTTGQYGINAGMILFNGFSTLNAVRQTAFAYKADKMNFEQAKLDLSIQVTLAYLQVLNNEELLNQAVSQMEVTTAQLERLRVLEKNEAVAPAVLYETQGQLANDKINLINVKASLAASKLILMQLLNTELPSDVKFEKININTETNTFEIDADKIHVEAEKIAPMLQSTEYRKTSSLKALQAARGRLFPTISLAGSVGTNYSSVALSPQNEIIPFDNQTKNNLNTYVGLSMQLPIFNSLRNKTQITLSRINYDIAKSQNENAKTRFKSLINQACIDLMSAQERYKVFQEQVENYSEAFKIAGIKFEKGVLTTFEYITSKNNFEKAKTNLITAQYEYIFRSKVLGFYRRSNI